MKTHEWEEPIKAAHNKRLAFLFMSTCITLQHTFIWIKTLATERQSQKEQCMGGPNLYASAVSLP